MNRDCWYYIIDGFVTNYEKHYQLKLVCRLFYSIVEAQTREFYKQIRHKICFQQPDGYEIYRNHFVDISLGQNQFAWVVSTNDILTQENLRSDDFSITYLGHRIIFSPRFSLCTSRHMYRDGTEYTRKVFHIRTQIEHANDLDSFEIKTSVALVRNKNFITNNYYIPAAGVSHFYMAFDNDGSCLEYLSGLKKYVMIVATIDFHVKKRES